MRARLGSGRMKSVHEMTPELGLIFRLSYRPMKAYLDALDGVERVGSFYRVPVRHIGTCPASGLQL
jgi:hypothetical protein